MTTHSYLRRTQTGRFHAVPRGFGGPASLARCGVRAAIGGWLTEFGNNATCIRCLYWEQAHDYSAGAHPSDGFGAAVEQLDQAFDRAEAEFASLKS